MASWLMRIDASSGKLCGRRRAICSGLHARAHRRGCRRPCRRPVHGTTSLGTLAPFGAMTAPSKRSCTYCCSWLFPASFAGFGRRAARSACHCAVVARYSRPPERVAALRRNSREIVDGARASRRAIARTPYPWACQSAICSRSVNARYRADDGGAEDLRCDAAIPPASRNHRVPTAGETPASTAASSLARPAAIATQNRRCSSCRRTEGRPGEYSLARPARSERRLRVIIATSSGKMLRRPIEFTQYASADYQRVLAQHRIVCSMSRRGDCWDNAVAESFFATLKVELVHDATWAARATARTDLFEYLELFYNRQRRHSALGYLSPRAFERTRVQEAAS